MLERVSDRKPAQVPSRSYPTNSATNWAPTHSLYGNSSSHKVIHKNNFPSAHSRLVHKMALLNSSSHSQLNTHRHYLRPLEPSTTTPLRRKVSTPRGFPIHKFPISITFSSSAPSTLPRHSWALPSVHYRFHRPSASPPTVGPVDPPAGDCALDSPRRRRPEVRSEDGRHCAAESSSTVSSCLWERSSIPLGRWCPGEWAN